MYMENIITFKQLTTKYMAWCEKHRSVRTTEWYQGHLTNFLAHLGPDADMPAMSMKPFHLVEWTDSKPTWGNSYKGSGIVAVKRAFNWGEEMGLIDNNPVKKTKKPTPVRREIYMTPEDFEEILADLGEDDPFKDIFQFGWYSGARPQESRAIEPRHVDLENERIVFPVLESKGKRSKRVIYLQGVALEIVQRLMAEGRPGKIFLNSRGTPWTKYALCNRFFRISVKRGKRLFPYAQRHGFGTRKLIQGHDHLTVAALMGHTDGSMLAKIYSHLDKDTEHLKRALAD